MKKIALAIALAFAAPTFAAGPLVQCLSGCPQKAEGGKLKADTQIADQWWLGPSVGLALAAREAGQPWETNIAFQFQYGAKFKPSWWTITPTFLSLDLGFQAGTSNVQAPDFVITIAPTVSLMDIFAIGYGPRFRFNNGTQVTGVIFVGLSTSFGSPQ